LFFGKNAANMWKSFIVKNLSFLRICCEPLLAMHPYASGKVSEKGLDKAKSQGRFQLN